MLDCPVIQVEDWKNTTQGIPNLLKAEGLINCYCKRNSVLGLKHDKERSILKPGTVGKI